MRAGFQVFKKISKGVLFHNATIADVKSHGIFLFVYLTNRHIAFMIIPIEVVGKLKN